MKKFLIGIVMVIVLVVIGMLGFLTFSDYQPEAVEVLHIESKEIADIVDSDSFTVCTWNIGYGALGANEDFFMDGGTKVRPDSESVIYDNMKNILSNMEELDSDFFMLQEIDVDSKRSYNVNQLDLITEVYSNYEYSFAKNYDVSFVPVPWPPMGEVEAGIATFSRHKIMNSERHKFEGNYSWPKNTVMLDRCFTTTVINLQNKEADLVLVNAHFSAYDDGSLREKQLKAAKDYITQEYDKGNYVVLGGDWNQTFESVDTSQFKLYKNGELYMPSVIPSDWLDSGWTYAIDDNKPTYRLLNAPYIEGLTQVGVIDGFVVSPNILVKEVEVLELDFKHSDHNPVVLEFELK